MQDSDTGGKDMDNRNTNCSVLRKGVVCSFPSASGECRAAVCGVVQNNNLTGRSHSFLSAHVSDVLPIKTKALRGREGSELREETAGITLWFHPGAELGCSLGVPLVRGWCASHSAGIFLSTIHSRITSSS